VTCTEAGGDRIADAGFGQDGSFLVFFASLVFEPDN